MEHAHEEQYFRKLVGLIMKIIFKLKDFFFHNIILKRGLTLAWADKFTGVHVYLVTWDGNRILGTYVLFWEPDKLF